MDVTVLLTVAASFEFISECLLPQAVRFYAVPGKAHRIAVHVSIGPGRKRTSIGGGNSGFVDGVTLSGVNILWLADEDYKVMDQDDQKYRTYSRSDFEDNLCIQILFPVHLVNITYSEFVKNLDYVQ